MAKTLKITTKDELFRHAGGLVLKSNLEELIDTSAIENTYKYADKLQKIKDITPKDGAWKFIDDTTTHLAEYAEIEGEYIAHLVAANLCDNDHGIDGVRFDVPNKIKKEITNSLAEYEKQYLDKKAVVDESFTVLNYITYNENEDEFQRAKENLGNIDIPSADNSSKRNFENSTMTLNMYACENLTMDNYAERLSNPEDAAAKEWATEAVENMMRGLYSNEEFEKLSNSGEDIMDSIYIGGARAASKYSNKKSYGEKCAAMINDIISGRYEINVARMEEVNGKFIGTDKVATVKIEPKPACEEKFSLWKAILRFFGIGKTEEKQKFEIKTSFSELDNSDMISKIKEYNLTNREFSETFAPICEAKKQYEAKYSMIDSYAFEANLEKPDAYFAKASEYYQGNNMASPKKYLDTLSRKPTRTSTFMAYAISKGMEFDNILNPSEADKEQLKAYGKEFIDLVAVPKPEEIAKQVYPDYDDAQLSQVIKTNDKQFREAYDNALNTKGNEIAEAYISMTETMSAFKEKLTKVNCMDIDGVAKNLPEHIFCNTAVRDLYQMVRNSPLQKTNERFHEAAQLNFNTQNGVPLSRAYIDPITNLSGSSKLPIGNFFGDISHTLSTVAILKTPELTTNCDEATYSAVTACMNEFTKEISDAQRNGQGKEVLKYAKDIITGKKPIPENLISEGEIDKKFGSRVYTTNLVECYLKDKEMQTEKTLDASRAL